MLVNYGGSCNVRCWYIMWPFGLHYGHFYGYLVYFVAIWYIFPRFGVLYQEKSGNPDLQLFQSVVLSCFENKYIWNEWIGDNGGRAEGEKCGEEKRGCQLTYHYLIHLFIRWDLVKCLHARVALNRVFRKIMGCICHVHTYVHVHCRDNSD
jgi:hypothetical protein